MLLLVGLLTPLAGLIITCNMVVAIAVSSGHNGFIAPGRLGYEYNLVLIAIALAIAGAGRLSLDHQLGLDQGSTLPIHQQGHDLSSGLRVQCHAVLTCQRLGASLPDGQPASSH